MLKHANILEACVFGIAVNSYENEICAWIKLKSADVRTSIDEVIKHCERNLLEFQVPRYVKIVDTFPTSFIGKYLRTEMSAKYRKELAI